MEIKRVGSNVSISKEKKQNAVKRDFSQDFSFQRERKNEQQLKKMLDDIKKRGNRLSITKCYADVRAYKNMIQDFLKNVVDYMYEVKKDISFWQTQYFITVETIDEKLEELTKMLLEQEAENISIASTIDEIQGIIVDIYK